MALKPWCRERFCTEQGIALPPSAPRPPANAVWPSPYASRWIPRVISGDGPNSACCCGYVRDSKARWHCGVDILGKDGDPVLATESGTVIRFKHFYKNVWCLFVECDSGYIINYGEVSNKYLSISQIGARVNAGETIAYLEKMDKSAMLHFEMYTSGLTSTWTNESMCGNQRWPYTSSPPSYLLDPTNYLIELGRRKLIDTAIDIQTESSDTSCYIGDKIT